MACCLFGRQAITQTNARLLSIGPLATNFSEIQIEILIQIYIQENAFENVVYETAAILSWGGWDKEFCIL